MIMAHFAVHLSTDGAAFDTESGGDRNTEVARILRELADELENAAPEGAFFKRLRDFNGNRVGFATSNEPDEVDRRLGLRDR
jgi:hypothetical protein